MYCENINVSDIFWLTPRNLFINLSYEDFSEGWFLPWQHIKILTHFLFLYRQSRFTIDSEMWRNVGETFFWIPVRWWSYSRWWWRHHRPQSQTGPPGCPTAQPRLCWQTPGLWGPLLLLTDCKQNTREQCVEWVVHCFHKMLNDYNG